MPDLPPLPDLRKQVTAATTDAETLEEFLAGAAEFLEDWPLYRRFEFQDRVLQSHIVEGGLSEGFLALPGKLVIHCPICKRPQSWKPLRHLSSDRGLLLLKRPPKKGFNQ